MARAVDQQPTVLKSQLLQAITWVPEAAAAVSWFAPLRVTLRSFASAMVAHLVPFAPAMPPKARVHRKGQEHARLGGRLTLCVHSILVVVSNACHTIRNHAMWLGNWAQSQPLHAELGPVTATLGCLTFRKQMLMGQGMGCNDCLTAMIFTQGRVMSCLPSPSSSSSMTSFLDRHHAYALQ